VIPPANPATFMKPRIILDIGFLGHAHDEKSARRGAQRVVRHLFDGLIASGTCEISFTATSHLAGAYEFLQDVGIDADKKLFCSPAQLRRSRKGRSISRAVHRTMDDRSIPARLRRYLLARAAHFYLRGEHNLPPDQLDRADIYHSPHTPFPASVRHHPRLKKFLTLHDFIPLKNPEYFPGNAKLFIDAVLSCLTPENFAFCVSEYTRNDTLNLSRIPPEHVFVTPLAADEKVFHPVGDTLDAAAVRAAHCIPGQPYFLAVSAQDRHKNFPHLIHCFGALVESGELRDTNLVIVGANPGRNPEVIQALANCPHAKSRVIATGFVPDEHLAALYSGATAFLFPSFAEGFGIPPLEAMQCGTPVIASNTTSIPEVVGDAGILLSPTEQDAWCQAMLRLCRETKLRGKLREKSLLRSKLFSWDRFITETLRGYRTSLECH
jgi:glycosyltransferase involved in cell wall biosynthesis